MKDLTPAFEALKAKQEAEAAKLSAQATAVAGSAVSSKTVAAAVRIVTLVADDRGRGGIGEPSADLRDVRSDPSFNAGLVVDLRTSTAQTDMLINGALTLGYASQVNGTPLNGAKLTYVPDAASQSALRQYPILGETSAEHAAAITEQLRREVLRAIGMPLTGQSDYHLVAEALATCNQNHASRVGFAVEEAYFAGTQAGVIDASKALVGQ